MTKQRRDSSKRRTKGQAKGMTAGENWHLTRRGANACTLPTYKAVEEDKEEKEEGE